MTVPPHKSHDPDLAATVEPSGPTGMQDDVGSQRNPGGLTRRARDSSTDAAAGIPRVQKQAGGPWLGVGPYANLPNILCILTGVPGGSDSHSRSWELVCSILYNVKAKGFAN